MGFSLSAIEGIIMGCLAVGLLIMLKLLLQMARFFDKGLEEDLEERLDAAKQGQEGNESDSFVDKNGYSWDYVMLFKVLGEDDPKPVVKMKKIVQDLHKGGLETELFYSLQRDEVYCKIRASYERIQKEADRVDYKILMDSEQLQKYCEKGRMDKKWGPINIQDANNECSYDPFEHIYGQYEPDKEDIADLYHKHPDGKNFNGKDRLKLIYTIITGRQGDGCCGLTINHLKEHKCIMDFFPLHEYTELLKLEKKWLRMWQWPWNQPFHDIKDYFGEKIGLYFVWLGHYTTWLVPPMICAALFWSNIAQAGTANTLSLLAFAPLIAIWATFFLEYWKRREATISMLWGTTGFEEEEQARPSYQGEESTSVVDGSKSLYFPDGEKRKRSILSQTAISCMVLLVLAAVGGITVMKLFLTSDSVEEALVISGYDFSLVIPSVANALQIQVMGHLFRGVALVLNDYENHKTDTEYEDSLIAKTFIFQFVNSYGILVYLAFIEDQLTDCPNDDCMDQLRKTLAIIFLIRLTSGNAVEVGIPYLKYRFGTLQKETSDADPDRTLSTAEQQYMGEEYDVMLGPFDDYSELIIQYGYSTLFVASFPLCLVWSFINNYVEIRVDGWRLCQQCRRPEPRGAEDIGTWYAILEIMSVAAVISNSAILCFTATILTDYKVSYRIWLFIVMEHAVFGLKYILAYIVDDVPEDVDVQLQRVEFLVSKVIQNYPDDNDDHDSDKEGDDEDFEVLEEDPE